MPNQPGPAAPEREDHHDSTLTVELIATLVAVSEGEPRILTIQGGDALPSGPFATEHRSLQAGLRQQVERQTHHPLGYLEQLYTFADRDRAPGAGQRVISISYLGLTREGGVSGAWDASWRGWYGYFPWEDRRGPSPAWFPELLRRVRAWAQAAPDLPTRRHRRQRSAMAFGLDESGWSDELVLQRYELLYEAGLVPEAPHRGADWQVPGKSMAHDHRRILATAIARLRAKIKYRPIVFELMPDRFTLLQLQRSVEALAGQSLHKQNFRRLVEQQALVEETGETSLETGGRPAKLYRFRRNVLQERAVAGTKLPVVRI